MESPDHAELLDAHLELEKRLERLTSLFLNCPAPIVTFDQRGVIFALNHRAAALLDVEVDAQQRPFATFVHPPDIRRFDDHLASCRQDGAARSEVRLCRAGGEPRRVELESRVADGPGVDAPIFQTVIHDIALEASRDHALADSERRYREIVETANEGICIVDAQNDIVFTNRRLAAMLGYPIEQLVGRSGYDLLLEEDREAARAAFERRCGPEDDIRLRRADGSALWTSVSTTVGRTDAGQFTGMLHMYADASARHELAEARHTLMRDLITAQERERARVARELHDQMGQHIVALALGVAKLARVTTEVEEAQPVISQLREIVDMVGRDVHTLAFQLRPAALDHLGLGVALSAYGEHVSARSGIEVDVHCDDLTALRLSGATQTAMYRIAQEAVTNAIKHARASRVSVVVEKQGDALVLLVEDDGVGLRPADADSTSRSTSGVGLTGIRERATLIGATVSIESTPGHGTTIYTRIPLGSSPERHK